MLIALDNMKGLIVRFTYSFDKEADTLIGHDAAGNQRVRIAPSSINASVYSARVWTLPGEAGRGLGSDPTMEAALKRVRGWNGGRKRAVVKIEHVEVKMLGLGEEVQTLHVGFDDDGDMCSLQAFATNGRRVDLDALELINDAMRDQIGLIGRGKLIQFAALLEVTG